MIVGRKDINSPIRQDSGKSVIEETISNILHGQDTTKEEQKGVKEYITNISKPTGRNFYE